MKSTTAVSIVVLIISFTAIKAQVPVKEEPRHHPVLQNKYIRLLDVWLPAGDTTLFHIHATPSLFIFLTTTQIGSQIKGKEWLIETATAGKAWFRSFLPDNLIHRVCNADTAALHVNDIEILSPYAANNLPVIKALPFPLLFENEKAFAYHLTKENFTKQVISNRGPMIAELVSGTVVVFHDKKTRQLKEIKTGGYLYIEPTTSFYFTASVDGEISMVLFEIK